MKVCSKQRERESLPEYTALEHSITERQQKDQTVIITFMQTRPDCHHNILQPLGQGGQWLVCQLLDPELSTSCYNNWLKSSIRKWITKLIL